MVMNRRSLADGLAQGEQFDAAVVDLDLQLVELGVVGVHLFGEGAVALHERLERLRHALLGEAGHAQQELCSFKSAQFLVEVPFHGLNQNLPVT